MDARQPLVEARAVLARAPDVAWAELEGEVVVYDTRTGGVEILNATAALLWQCIDGVSSLGEIIADLADAFGVPAVVVDEQCRPVVEVWLTDELVVAVDETSLARGTSTAQSVWRHLADPPNA